MNMLQLHKNIAAKQYFVKALRMSWITKDLKSEINIYDYLGICSYYQGDIIQAKYYHRKMVLGAVETDYTIKRIS